jgi:hypothetical protein
MTLRFASPRSARKSTNRLLALVLLVPALVGAASAQTPTTARDTDGTTPLALSPGSPAGSYSLSGFESVNLYDGGLSFALPLYRVGGRGAAGYTVMLPFEQKWTVERRRDQFSGDFSYFPTREWWSSNGATAPALGGLKARHAGSDSLNCPAAGTTVYTKTLTRVTFTAPDGTEYEMIDSQTGGQAHEQVCVTSGFSRGAVFVTTDGTSATFISDSAVLDTWMAGDSDPTPPPA